LARTDREIGMLLDGFNHVAILTDGFVSNPPGTPAHPYHGES
jgi:hypothetical protein